MLWLKLVVEDQNCKFLVFLSLHGITNVSSFRYVPPSPNRLDEDISEIMQKEGSDNDSQTGDDIKENEQPAKRMREDESQVWDSSEMFLVETPVSWLEKM